jgi:multidrug efflux pump subunit AcrA (membrane-fusion protein)
VTTIGQVVTTGPQLLVVTPKEGPLQVEALVANLDIGCVKIGQEAAIKVDAFPFTRFGVAHGRVVRIASEAIDEQEAKRSLANATASPNSANAAPASAPGQPESFVFPVTVALDESTMKIGDSMISLAPGMTVSVEIKTDSRRVIGYRLSPLAKVASEAMKERSIGIAERADPLEEHDRAIAAQVAEFDRRGSPGLPIRLTRVGPIRSARHSGFHPADSHGNVKDRLSGAARTRLLAKRRTTAMLRAPWSLRRRDWSSPQTTSRVQPRAFSTNQWRDASQPREWACLDCFIALWLASGADAYSSASATRSDAALLLSAVNSGNLNLTEVSIWRASKQKKAGRRCRGPARRIPRHPGSEDMRRIAISIIAAVAWAATATLPTRAEAEQGKALAPLTDDLSLMEPGLGSLCFAGLAARLEDALGADPFTSAEFERFPNTISELTAFTDGAVV